MWEKKDKRRASKERERKGERGGVLRGVVVRSCMEARQLEEKAASAGGHKWWGSIRRTLRS